MMTGQEREWVNRLRAFALDNYNVGGWDYLVECWSDEDILDAFAGATTWEEALRLTTEVVNIMDERRKDVQGEVF